MVKISKFSYDTGKSIVKENKSFKYFYMILEGNVKMSFNHNKLHIIFSSLENKSFFGEFNLLNNTYSQFNYDVSDHFIDYHRSKAFKCRLLLIKKTDFIDILSKYEKALKNFKMISLFRDDYFSKLRRKIKRNINEGVDALISHLETKDKFLDLSNLNENEEIMDYIKNKFFNNHLKIRPIFNYPDSKINYDKVKLNRNLSFFNKFKSLISKNIVFISNKMNK